MFDPGGRSVGESFLRVDVSVVTLQDLLSHSRMDVSVVTLLDLSSHSRVNVSVVTL